MNTNNSSNTSSIVSKIWAFCNTLRDDGVGYGDYLEQLTYLLFLKIESAILCHPLNNKKIFVQTVESRLTVADKMEESISQNLQQAGALKQSILKKAFEGTLVE